jgi:hypothetical protein
MKVVRHGSPRLLLGWQNVRQTVAKSQVAIFF